MHAYYYGNIDNFVKNREPVNSYKQQFPRISKTVFRVLKQQTCSQAEAGLLKNCADYQLFRYTAHLLLLTSGCAFPAELADINS